MDAAALGGEGAGREMRGAQSGPRAGRRGRVDRYKNAPYAGPGGRGRVPGPAGWALAGPRAAPPPNVPRARAGLSPRPPRAGPGGLAAWRAPTRWWIRNDATLRPPHHSARPGEEGRGQSTAVVGEPARGRQAGTRRGDPRSALRLALRPHHTDLGRHSKPPIHGTTLPQCPRSRCRTQ